MQFSNGFPHSRPPSSAALRWFGVFAAISCVVLITSGPDSSEDIGSIIVLGIFAVFGLVSWVDFFSEKADDKKKVSDMSKEVASKDKLQSETKSVIENIEEKTHDSKPIETMSPEEALKCAHAPVNCYVGADNLPACKNGLEKWGEGYTFYAARDRGVFHTRRCSLTRRYSLLPINAFKVKQGIPSYKGNIPYYPCYHCKPELPDLSWYDLYIFFTTNPKYLFEVDTPKEPQQPRVYCHPRD